jgi:hypothetical protein
MYPLKEVLLLVTCATIASCDDFDEIAAWEEHNLDFLRRFSDYHHGIPCERWLRSLFNRVNPTLFARRFETWVAPNGRADMSLSPSTARPPGAPMIGARGSKPCTRSAPTRPRRG